MEQAVAVAADIMEVAVVLLAAAAAVVAADLRIPEE
jgi:hypothetical protein